MTKPVRQKFESRSILIRSSLQVHTVKCLVDNAPIDPDFPIEVVFREPVKARGLDQNGLYWKRLGEIGEQGWFEGRLFSKEVWHIYAGKHIMPEEIITRDGETRSKWIESPDGDPVVISTTKLEKGCFAKYTTMVEAFGTSLGVRFSEKAA